jgi:hypothetical protein
MVCLLGKLSARGQNGRFQVEFGRVRGIDMNTHAGQRRLEGFLAARIEHFVANGGGIGIPREQNQFGRGSAVIGAKLQVNEAVTTIVFGQGGAKIIVRGRTRTLAFNDNGFLVLNHVNVVTQLFALLQFERIEQIAHFLVGHDTGRLCCCCKKSGERERAFTMSPRVCV